MRVCWFCKDNKFFFFAYQRFVNIVKHDPWLSNFIKSKSFLVTDIEMTVVSIQENFNHWRTVVNDVISIEIGSCSFGEDPSILVFGHCVAIIGFRWALDEKILIVEHNLLYFAIFHQRIFVDQSRIWNFMPIYLVDCMFVSQSNDNFVLVVVAVYSESNKTMVSVSASDWKSLRLKDVKSDKASIKV